MAEIKKGDKVSIHYTGRLEDGTEFDSSREREPLAFEAGSEELIPGVSQGVVGMKEGESKTITVPPEKGYGEHRPELLQRVPKEQLPDDVEVGAKLQAQAGSQTFPVVVSAIEGEEAVVDANHPLAGKTLVFDVEVVGVEGA